MALQNVRIKALKAGVTVAGLTLQAGQVIVIDLEPSQIADAQGSGDIAVDDGSGKVDLSAVAVEPSTNPADNAPKAFTPQHSQILEVTGATPEADKAVLDTKAKRGPMSSVKSDKADK